MRKLPFKILLKCFLRSYMIGAGQNTRGLQNIGFVHAMAPGLDYIHAAGGGFSDACRRYSPHHNCHYLWTPLLVGAFLNIETAIAQGLFPDNLLTGLKDTTLNSLSGLGDSLFSGSLAVCVSLLLCLLAVLGLPRTALAVLGVCLLAGQAWRVCCFWAGYAYGLKVLGWLTRLRLINKGDWIKLLNALLLLALLAGVFFAGRGESLAFSEYLGENETLRARLLWFLPLGFSVAAAFASERLHVPRVLAIVPALCVITAFMWLN